MVTVARALAGTVLKPGDTVVGTPGTHDDAHVSRKGISHTSDVASVLLGNINVASLCQSELVRCLAKFDLDMERLMWVDFSSGSKGSFLLEISGILTTSVAVVVMWTVAITGVWGSSPGELVGLHNIELWAPLSSDVVGITVVVAIGIVWLAIRSNRRKGDSVEGGDTATVSLAEVNVVLNWTVEEVRSEEAIWIEAWTLREGGSGIVSTVNARSASATLRSQVEGFVFPVDLNCNGIETIDSWVASVWVSQLLLSLDHAEASEGESFFHLVLDFV